MKALMGILETLDSQAEDVEDNLEQWALDVKKSQTLIVQLLDDAEHCSLDVKHHYDRCQSVKRDNLLLFVL
jgi:hypothetical protein